ncbi:MAG: sulfotransferase family 2 domain-containing protein [Vicingus serpentipes]|nr:sulfotransferase family 2 domain-containing protein [Vicingus serpentipes]
MISKIFEKKKAFSKFIPSVNLPVENPFFVHIHLPKTGGTTFNTILRKNFNENFEEFSGRFIFLFDKFKEEQVLRFMNLQTSIDCVTSHNFNAFLPYDNEIRPIVAIAFLRDPVDLFFSLYFHLRHRGGNFPAARMDLKEYIDYRIKNKFFKEGFLYNLTEEQTDKSFEFVKRLVETNRLLLFDTYRMEDAMGILKINFPKKFNELGVTIKNISIKDQTITEEDKSKVAKHIVKYDYKLLDLANEQMDRLLKK